MGITRPIIIPARSRRLPSAIFFEEDAVARALVVHCNRIQHSSFEEAGPVRLEGENVFILSDERLVARHLKLLRSPNVRVIALSDRRFRDACVDGAVYAYLPVDTPPALLERAFDNATDHMHLVLTRREASDKLAVANSEIQGLNQIGAALTAEHDTKKLLQLILSTCREITRADAGSIYLKTEPSEGEDSTDSGQPEYLRFMLAQNDSIEVPFSESLLPIDDNSIAGYVAHYGNMVMVEDAYEMESWAPYVINKQFDLRTGYHTRSILAVAMKSPKGKVVGVVQLINCKRNPRARLRSREDVEREVLPFSTRQMEIVSSLASQAAVAYENSQHYQNVERLFEGFVKAAVAAAEQRDPTTAGHAFRVTNLTIALAEETNRDEGHFAGIEFSPAEMREIRYAALLHDLGKLGVREQVLTKARKLQPHHRMLIAVRFDLARRSAQAESAACMLECLREEGPEGLARKAPQIEHALQEQLAVLAGYLQIIEASDVPSIMPEGTSTALCQIAATTYLGSDGQPYPLLTQDELRVLSIRKGSLSDEDRAEAEAHAVYGYNLLKQIPWTGELRNVPEFARDHHEKPNGKGYPAGLMAEEIVLPARMMAIADVFDALTAADRPYKPAVSVERALRILDEMARHGELDVNLFELFVRAKVYELHKVECFEY